jgi:hypothetical protein
MNTGRVIGGNIQMTRPFDRVLRFPAFPKFIEIEKTFVITYQEVVRAFGAKDGECSEGQTTVGKWYTSHSHSQTKTNKAVFKVYNYGVEPKKLLFTEEVLLPDFSISVNYTNAGPFAIPSVCQIYEFQGDIAVICPGTDPFEYFGGDCNSITIVGSGYAVTFASGTKNGFSLLRYFEVNYHAEYPPYPCEVIVNTSTSKQIPVSEKLSEYINRATIFTKKQEITGSDGVSLFDPCYS